MQCGVPPGAPPGTRAGLPLTLSFSLGPLFPGAYQTLPENHPFLCLSCLFQQLEARAESSPRSHIVARAEGGWDFLFIYLLLEVSL